MKRHKRSTSHFEVVAQLAKISALRHMKALYGGRILPAPSKLGIYKQLDDVPARPRRCARRSPLHQVVSLDELIKKSLDGELNHQQSEHLEKPGMGGSDSKFRTVVVHLIWCGIHLDSVSVSLPVHSTYTAFLDKLNSILYQRSFCDDSAPKEGNRDDHSSQIQVLDSEGVSITADYWNDKFSGSGSPIVSRLQSSRDSVQKLILARF